MKLLGPSALTAHQPHKEKLTSKPSKYATTLSPSSTNTSPFATSFSLFIFEYTSYFTPLTSSS